jgi:hypothetical protein
MRDNKDKSRTRAQRKKIKNPLEREWLRRPVTSEWPVVNGKCKLPANGGWDVYLEAKYRLMMTGTLDGGK